MIRTRLRTLHVLGGPPGGCLRLLRAGPMVMPCRIGRNGSTHDKREGDGRSPVGTFRILNGFWRRDRRLPPRTGLPMRPARSGEGWCDASGHGNYNRLVRLPFSASHETMQRADRQYDVVLVIDWNIRPRRQGRGSAIFLHLMAEGGTGTAGCVAVPPDRIDRLMARIGPHTRIVIR